MYQHDNNFFLFHGSWIVKTLRSIGILLVHITYRMIEDIICNK